MAYCSKCGGTGTRIDGSICDCVRSKDTVYADLVGIEIPEQYQGIRFSGELVPADVDISYSHVLEDLHTSITTMQLESKNICICSPPMHSKTVWAYSCIQNLFRQRLPVLPLYDVLEMRRMMYDYDMGRSQEADQYDVKYLFVKIPAEITYQVRTTIATLIDRRVRRGKGTIYIYNGTWNNLTSGDGGMLSNLLGDGSYSSMRVYTYSKTKAKE